MLLAVACLIGGAFRLACSVVLASGSWDGNGRVARREDLADTNEMHYGCTWYYCRNPMYGLFGVLFIHIPHGVLISGPDGNTLRKWKNSAGVKHEKPKIRRLAEGRKGWSLLAIKKQDKSRSGEEGGEPVL